jgi:hypothetical protein
MLVQVDVTTLFHQAPKTINDYLLEGIKSIDRQFGNGYAKNHPELLGAFIKACALDFNSSIIAAAIEQSAPIIASSIDNINIER